MANISYIRNYVSHHTSSITQTKNEYYYEQIWLNKSFWHKKMCETHLDHLNSLQHILKKESIFSQKGKKNESAFIAVLRLASTSRYFEKSFYLYKIIVNSVDDYH